MNSHHTQSSVHQVSPFNKQDDIVQQHTNDIHSIDSIAHKTTTKREMSAAPKTHCTRFVQNAWKKNFCSNCYKTREEHDEPKSKTSKMEKISMITPTAAVKSIIKVNLPSSVAVASGKSRKKKSVNFPKEMSEIIGFDGGEWSDSNESDEDDDYATRDDVKVSSEVVYVEDEHLQKLTKTNTEFNTNNGNLLGDPTVNIKKTFAALKLGEFRCESC